MSPPLQLLSNTSGFAQGTHHASLSSKLHPSAKQEERLHKPFLDLLRKWSPSSPRCLGIGGLR